MGPAELLDYDRKRLRGLVIEDGSGQSHVAIVAKALGIAAVGQARGVVERVDRRRCGDRRRRRRGEVHLRPSADVIAAYSDKARFRARRQRQYRALQGRARRHQGRRARRAAHERRPARRHAASARVGRRRRRAVPHRAAVHAVEHASQARAADRRSVPRDRRRSAGDKPVIFRTLDIGGDKVLHYLRQPQEENPAMGWRAMRMGLDRPALLRTQIRAMLRAAAGHELRCMIPMVSAAHEMDEVRALVEKERAIVKSKGHEAAKRVAIGAMIEVPCLLFELDALMKKVDFVSVGSNDLMQFMFAADRTNARVGSRYDALSPAPLQGA